MRNKSSLAAENVFFPEEILIEILSYVEAKYLLGCKSVCKLWCAVIRSKQLVEMHMMRNGHRYYDMHITDGSLNSDGIVQKIEYICHRCRGLVLSSLSAASSPVTYHISNPTTNYSMDIPHPHKGMRSMHVFLNTCTGSYNVLSIYFDEKKMTRHSELLDLGGQSNDPSPNPNLSWTTLNISEFENVSIGEIWHSKYCMSTEGNIILFILYFPYNSSGKLKITCVDIVTLTCTSLDVTVNRSLHWLATGFQLWRGKPSVVFIVKDKLHILALEDYKTQKWAETMVFSLPFRRRSYALRIIHLGIYTDGPEDILLCVKESLWPQYMNIYRCDLYKLESKVWSHILSLPQNSLPQNSLPRKVPATLVSVKGMQPKKKRTPN